MSYWRITSEGAAAAAARVIGTGVVALESDDDEKMAKGERTGNSFDKLILCRFVDKVSKLSKKKNGSRWPKTISNE